MFKKLALSILCKYFKKHPLIRYKLLHLLKIAQSQPNDLIILDYPIKSKQRYKDGNKTFKVLYGTINRDRGTYIKYLNTFLSYKNKFINIPKTLDNISVEPVWYNNFLPGLDAVALYCFICLHKPNKIFEIGSGNSTKFARKAIKDNNLETKITSFDPCPRLEIDSICDEVVRMPIEDVELSVFEKLEKNDILFVDCSHRVFMNSDATVIYLEILPILKSGVIVEFHDIFLPFDYPEVWKERYYSEQYLLAAYLLSENRRFEIMLPNQFIARDKELSDILNPLWEHPQLKGVEKNGVSLWVQIK